MSAKMAASRRVGYWTHEDRDYVWRLRFQLFVVPLTVMPAVALGMPIILSWMAQGSADAKAVALLIGIAVFFSVLGAFADDRYRAWLHDRYPYYKRVQIFENVSFAGKIFLDETALGVMGGAGRAENCAVRTAALAPLVRRARVIRALLMTGMWIALCAVIITVISARSGYLPPVAAFGMIIAALLAIGGLHLLWDLLRYDIPARWNPLAISVDLSREATAFLANAASHQGLVWCMDRKTVPRSLFASHAGPLLLGDTETAALAFGLWRSDAIILKDTSLEVARYYQMVEAIDTAMASDEAEHALRH